jgi:hypothetical protein
MPYGLASKTLVLFMRIRFSSELIVQGCLSKSGSNKGIFGNSGFLHFGHRSLIGGIVLEISM